jgi:hypothetical protein
MVKQTLEERGKLIVIPKSGLSNRLRVIATSVKLARATNKELSVFWESNQYLNASYLDLFKTPSKITISKPSLKYKLWLRLQSLSPKLNSAANLYLKLLNFDFVFFDNMAELVWQNKLDLENELRQSQNVLMSTCQELNYFDLEDYKLFVPTPELQKEIDIQTRRFSENTIGIHIRSTDNEEAKKKSPFPVFNYKIEKEIKLNETATFFLSTDNEEYQKALSKKFGPDKIFFHEKEFRRDVTQGIKDAVIDLFCLSKTAKIYGSYYSSFSYVAGRIGNVPVEVLTHDKMNSN